jgi:hypothetical protein
MDTSGGLVTVVGVEIPACPVVAHAGSRVVRGGWYGKPPHRRQRWVCRPGNGDAPHRFTPVLTRQGEPRPVCVECSTELEEWEGQAGARDYRFAAREIGDALVAVARGTSYKSAAEMARRSAERMPPSASENRGWRYRNPARDGQLVANWVDVYSELVCAGELPERWPAVLLLDCRGFRITSGKRAGRSFYVFACVGIEIDGHGEPQPSRLWRLEPFARKDQAAWEAFLGALPGVPKVIVSDADHALACAVESVFADAEQAPEHRLCEWHLSRKLREHLPDSVLKDLAHPITRALPNAFHTTQAWADLLDAIHAENDSGCDSPLTLTLRWLATYGPRVEKQIATRGHDGSHSTGAVEAVLRELDRRLHHRAGSFTNRARMAKLLALMTLELTGRANPRAWADRIRERLYLTGGHPINQRPHDDPKHTYSLIS